jgi:hypothetical protein
MDADANAEPTLRFLGVQLRSGIDNLEPAHHGTGRRREYGMDGVTFRLDLRALMSSDRRARDLEEAADHGGGGGVPIPLCERGEAAHIGEQKSPIGGSPGIDAGVVEHVRQMVVPLMDRMLRARSASPGPTGGFSANVAWIAAPPTDG